MARTALIRGAVSGRTGIVDTGAISLVDRPAPQLYFRRVGVDDVQPPPGIGFEHRRLVEMSGHPRCWPSNAAVEVSAM